jgi:hypothetical protein
MSVWLTKLRTHYWEVRNAGERYKILRVSKNRLPDHVGKYTLEAVAERLNFQPSILKKIEAGVENPTVFNLMIADLGITKELFDAVPARAVTTTVTPPATVQASIEAIKRPDPFPKDKTEVAKNKTEVATGEFRVVSYHHEDLVLSITKDTICIYPNDAVHIKKGEFVGQADNPGGTTIRPRTTIIKIGK